MGSHTLSKFLENDKKTSVERNYNSKFLFYELSSKENNYSFLNKCHETTLTLSVEAMKVTKIRRQKKIKKSKILQHSLRP